MTNKLKGYKRFYTTLSRIDSDLEILFKETQTQIDFNRGILELDSSLRISH